MIIMVSYCKGVDVYMLQQIIQEIQHNAHVYLYRTHTYQSIADTNHTHTLHTSHT